MVLQKNQYELRKNQQVISPTRIIPVTETSTSPDDYRRNKGKFIPIEQVIMYQILDELKAIHILLKK